MDEKTRKAIESLDDCVAYAKAVATSPLRDREWRKALAHLTAMAEENAALKDCDSLRIELAATNKAWDIKQKQLEEVKEAHHAAAGRVIELLDEKIALKADLARWSPLIEAAEKANYYPDIKSAISTLIFANHDAVIVDILRAALKCQEKAIPERDK